MPTSRWRGWNAGSQGRMLVPTHGGKAPRSKCGTVVECNYEPIHIDYLAIPGAESELMLQATLRQGHAHPRARPLWHVQERRRGDDASGDRG